MGSVSHSFPELLERGIFHLGIFHLGIFNLGKRACRRVTLVLAALAELYLSVPGQPFTLKSKRSAFTLQGISWIVKRSK